VIRGQAIGLAQVGRCDPRFVIGVNNRSEWTILGANEDPNCAWSMDSAQATEVGSTDDWNVVEASMDLLASGA
jgi:hypothetical protein